MARPNRNRLPWWQTRAGLLCRLLVLGLLLIVCLVVMALGIVIAATERDASGPGITIAVMFGVLLLMLAAAGRHLEHQLHGGRPVASAYPGARAAGGASRSWRWAGLYARLPGRVRIRRVHEPRFFQRGYSPVAAIYVGTLMIAVVVACSLGIASELSQIGRSRFTQVHGVAVAGTVTGVRNSRHCGRGRCSDSSSVRVRLSRPVDGHVTTVVHYPAYAPLADGQSTKVLVDPQQPSYAELPGTRFKSYAGAWMTMVIIALLAATLGAREWRELYRIVRFHRLDRASDPVGSDKRGHDRPRGRRRQ